jgi:hypothetical protein
MIQENIVPIEIKLNAMQRDDALQLHQSGQRNHFFYSRASLTAMKI